jgi:competence protein ComEC
MFSLIFKKLGKTKLFIVSLTIFVFLGFSVIYLTRNKDFSVYFIDVGQGDSQLIRFSDVDILIDGGPINGKLINQLGSILPYTDRYIDLVIMTHPQEDHFGGLIDVFKRYNVGAFLYNGQKGDSLALADLEKAIMNNSSKVVIMNSGDKIKYKNLLFETIIDETQEDLNERSLVMKMSFNDINFLFTGDIGKKVENNIKNVVDNIDILKVSHHGSKYSSSAQFLNVIKPKISVIEVGKNSYGHPAFETLDKLEKINSKILRTDMLGTIKIEVLENDDKKSVKIHY